MCSLLNNSVLKYMIHAWLKLQEHRSRGPMVKSYTDFELSSSWHPQPIHVLLNNQLYFHSYIYYRSVLCPTLKIQGYTGQSHCPLDAYILMGADRQKQQTK